MFFQLPSTTEHAVGSSEMDLSLVFGSVFFSLPSAVLLLVCLAISERQ